MAAMTKRLYALASGLGLVERNNKDDLFHQLVYGITGKEHVSELTVSEANAVQAELKERMKLKNHNKSLKKRQEDPVPGIMTDSMKRLAWFLAYRLEELDDKNIPVPANIRLAGAVKKVLGITADQSDPLVWIKFNEGMKLIEYIDAPNKVCQSH